MVWMAYRRLLSAKSTLKTSPERYGPNYINREQLSKRSFKSGNNFYF